MIGWTMIAYTPTDAAPLALPSCRSARILQAARFSVTPEEDSHAQRFRTHGPPSRVCSASHLSRQHARCRVGASLRRRATGTLSRPGTLAHPHWGGGYLATPDADPAWLYADVLVGIVPERDLNNGQPSAHPMWIAAAAPVMGEHMVHVGAGVGYYSAIMAHMVGSGGALTAVEFDRDLAARATSNLAHLPNAKALQGDGSLTAFAPADVIYVNAGASRPAEAWLDGLKDRGRLILPLTTKMNSSEPFNASVPPVPSSNHAARQRLRRRLHWRYCGVSLRRCAGRDFRAGPCRGFWEGRISRRQAAAPHGRYSR